MLEYAKQIYMERNIQTILAEHQKIHDQKPLYSSQGGEDIARLHKATP
jgi:hypothetical protein